MSDAARAKALEDYHRKIRFIGQGERQAFSAGWNAAAEQTAALRERFEASERLRHEGTDREAKAGIRFNEVLQEAAVLREENARLRAHVAELKTSNERFHNQVIEWREKAEQRGEENARLAMKIEQYQRQLDDRWAGVVGVTNQHVERMKAKDEEHARLRGAMLRETEAFHNTGGECGWCGDPWLTHTASCLIGKWRALLADPEGQ